MLNGNGESIKKGGSDDRGLSDILYSDRTRMK